MWDVWVGDLTEMLGSVATVGCLADAHAEATAVIAEMECFARFNEVDGRFYRILDWVRDCNTDLLKLYITETARHRTALAGGVVAVSGGAPISSVVVEFNDDSGEA